MDRLHGHTAWGYGKKLGYKNWSLGDCYMQNRLLMLTLQMGSLKKSIVECANNIQVAVSCIDLS